jgi:hypothetical protein
VLRARITLSATLSTLLSQVILPSKLTLNSQVLTLYWLSIMRPIGYSLPIFALHRPTTMNNTLPVDVLLEIFNFCRIDEVTTSSLLPWKWHRLAHVCRTWRDVLFASSRRLNLELLCTHGTPVRKNLGHLPALPTVIHFSGSYEDSDEDNIIAALEHPNRIHAVRLNVPHSLLKKMSTVAQEPFPELTHLWLESKGDTRMPVLPDAFLGGCAPRLQKVHLDGIPFPAAPTLLLSARDLVDVSLRDLTDASYVSPEVMVASLAVLPRLKYLTFGFRWRTSYPNRIRMPLPITRAVLPALIRFHFDGLSEYFEDFVALIDAPQLNRLGIGYLDLRADFLLFQLCKFLLRSEKLSISVFRHADLIVIPSTGDTPRTSIIELWGQSFFTLSTRDEGMSRVLSEIAGMLSDVDRLSIGSAFTGYGRLGSSIQWLDLLQPFTAVRSLSVQAGLSQRVALALKNVTGVGAAEVMPALELLYLENQPVTSVGKFIAARQKVGRPVTFVNKECEFQERLTE